MSKVILIGNENTSKIIQYKSIQFQPFCINAPVFYDTSILYQSCFQQCWFHILTNYNFGFCSNGMLAHESHFLYSIPSGGFTSVFSLPMSFQLVDKTVPPDSWNDLFIARFVLSSAFA